ncbi:MAG: hypothetical protein J5563_04295 [Clostridia bacterium]|nr:hypothetical protein [Clostridia bacterium]
MLSEQEIISIELEDKLAEFVKKGGNLLIFGNCFGEKYPADSDGITLEYRDYDLLEKIAGKKFSSCGKYEVVTIGDSKIVVCKNFMRTSSNEGSMVVDGNVKKAFSELALNRQVRLEKAPSQGYVETTYRSNASGSEFYLHLINMDVNDEYTSERYEVSVEIPAGAVFVSAEAFSPFNEEVALEATEKNGRLFFEGEFGIYSMVKIKYRY